MTLADAYYWNIYWKYLSREERIKLADKLLDCDSGERDWVSKEKFEDFPKHIQDALLHKGNYSIADDYKYSEAKHAVLRGEGITCFDEDGHEI